MGDSSRYGVTTRYMVTTYHATADLTFSIPPPTEVFSCADGIDSQVYAFTHGHETFFHAWLTPSEFVHLTDGSDEGNAVLRSWVESLSIRELLPLVACTDAK